MEDIFDEIMRLKKERNAIILAHVYQPEEIQEIADFTGDSFGLSRKAASTDADVIVFCGVRFMAETANILSPDKITLLPAIDAGCQMFTDALEADVRKIRSEHPDALIVSYVNTPASVKAMSDICCTSSNAAAVVKSLPKNKEVIFLPDGNLGSFAESESKRPLIKWAGGCPIHARLTADDIKSIGYDTKKRVVETIEIDYLTLNESPNGFVIDTEIEGSPESWLEYANNYPETASFLVVNDKIVGYSQIQFITQSDFDLVLSGERMIDADMEEFYGFGGEFCCYITIMPILKQYENQKNYVMLLDELFAKFERLAIEDDVKITSLAISVYSNLLEKMLIPLGFKHVGNNPAKGKIYSLDFSTLKDNAIFKRKYSGKVFY